MYSPTAGHVDKQFNMVGTETFGALDPLFTI